MTKYSCHQQRREALRWHTRHPTPTNALYIQGMHRLTSKKLSNLLAAAAIMHFETPTPKHVPKRLIPEVIKATLFDGPPREVPMKLLK